MPLDSTIRGLEQPRSMFIDGESVKAVGGNVIDVENPATEEIITTVPSGAAEDVDMAVAAARRTFEASDWRGKKYTERAEIMWRWSDLLQAHSQEFAEMEMLDNGMPLYLARGMVASAVSTIRTCAGMPGKIYGKTSEISGPGLEAHAFSLAEPVGVVGLITPWNGPVAVAATKSASALAAGCSIVLKPAEQTPLTSLRLAELAMEAGVPAGVFNVVTGYGEAAGAAIAAHPDVDKISFTGSTTVGKKLLIASAGNLKRLSLELGGKSPVFVFGDADLETAIPSVAMGIFNNSGQICYAGSRVYAQGRIFDRLVGGVAEFARKIRVGKGWDEGTQLGPLVSAKQRETVLNYVERGKLEGAEVAAGGHAMDGRGYFMEPTVFVNASDQMQIIREEIFGPVVSIGRFSGLEDLAQIGNNTPYGLGAGVFTQNIATAHRAAKQLRAGNVWVNCYGFTDKSLPFGGYKQSGFGREGSIEGIEAFLEKKSVYIKL